MIGRSGSMDHSNKKLDGAQTTPLRSMGRGKGRNVGVVAKLGKLTDKAFYSFSLGAIVETAGTNVGALGCCF
jgi:hypothetical protein